MAGTETYGSNRGTFIVKAKSQYGKQKLAWVFAQLALSPTRTARGGTEIGGRVGPK
jgi:hypothetical protein